MSTEQNAPQSSQPVPAQHHAPNGAPGSAPGSAPGGAPQPRTLSTFLKVSIILLAALSIASISLLFIGDFEGKFERIFSTFVAFAVFVVLTAFDTRRGMRTEWYAPVALIANSYILALLLIVTWMTPAGWTLGGNIFWKGLLVVLVTRAVVGASQLLMRMGDGRPRTLGTFALITSLLATVSGIFFTAPVAIDVFRVRIPELYWKFAVATLLLTALGLAITLLLRWAYTSDDRERARREQAAAQAVAPQTVPSSTFPMGVPGAAQPVAPAAPTVQITEVHTSQVTEAQTPQTGQPLLPWPRYADGRPLPVGPDGQPDFSAVNPLQQ